MGMYKQPLLILFWETLTFWNPVAKFDIAPKNRCWTAAEYQYSVIYFISRKHQKKWENHFSLHQRDRWTPVSKFWAKLQFMVWDRGEREFPFPVIPYSLIVLGVSESRESRSLRSHGSHRTLDKSQTNAISVTFCALVEVSWGNHWKAIAEKIKRIVIDAIFCPIVQASWGHIWKRKV